MNGMIAENLAALSDDAKSPEELDAVSTPLAAIPEPPRTPLVAPSDNYTFRYDETEIGSFRTGTLKEFLSNGQVPVLFVDGHVETISPAEYSNRNLDEMPLAPATEP
jgi:prepilin-type processing-associated H-X9-DG protein